LLPDQAREQQRRRYSDRQSGADEPAALQQHHAADLASGCAQRRPNP
jgi:hypothetical protein